MISIYEAIKKIDPHFFDYSNIASSMWNNLISQAKKDFKIHFDLENNDLYRRQERVITIPQDQWDFTECKFKCRLYQAGGDWENPVFYFRCQLINGYAGHIVNGQYKKINKYDRENNGCFVFIPGKTQGNYSLIPGRKDGEWVANDGDKHKDGIDPENNDRDCWKALKEYLTKLVALEIEKIRSEREENETADENSK